MAKDQVQFNVQDSPVKTKSVATTSCDGTNKKKVPALPTTIATVDDICTVEARIVEDRVFDAIPVPFDIEAAAERCNQGQELPWYKPHHRAACLLLSICLLAVGVLIGGFVVSRQTTDIPSKSSFPLSKSNARKGQAPPYVVLKEPATCEEVLAGNNTNSYYDKHGEFLCRTRRRPCEAWPEVDRLDMLLSGGFYIKMQMDISEATWPSDDEPVVGVGGPSEAWAVRTDADGNLKINPWNSNYYLFAEGEWVYGSKFRTIAVDWNDYQFGSLDCSRGKWDDDDFLFIIIDGVLVDSCPPYLAEDCRACTA